jgi:hypothetical protein
VVICDSAAVIWSLLVVPPETRESSLGSMVGRVWVGMAILGVW